MAHKLVRLHFFVTVVSMDRRKFLAGLPASLAGAYAMRFLAGCGGASASGSMPANPTPGRTFDYQLNYLPCYGQSLSLGGKGVPVLSTVQRFDSVMFAGGVLAQGYSSDLAADYGSLVPLVENDSLTNFNVTLTGTTQPGESPESGTFEAIKELMQSQDGLTTQNITYRFLGSAPGRGDTTLMDLSQGTVPYQRLIYEVTQAAALAKTMGLTFGVPCVSWMQGESDNATPAAEYLAALQSLFQALNSDIKTAGGQSKDVQFLMYQTAAAGCYPIACAQYQLAQTAANVHIASPCYFLQTDGAPWYDMVHLDNVSYKTMGAYFGSAYKRLIVNGEAWLPLSPAGISAAGNVITIKLNVYGGAMVVADTSDTTTTNSIHPALGFGLLDAGGNVLDIDNQVAVTGSNEITITAPGPVTSGFALEYGNGGGNIRDNFGDQYVFNGGGLNIAMHNWLTVFYYQFP
jgi:hypothetical protein